MIISDILFKNVYGTTSKKYDPKVGTLVCSDTSVRFHLSHSIQAGRLTLRYLEMPQYSGTQHQRVSPERKDGHLGLYQSGQISSGHQLHLRCRGKIAH